MARKDVGKIDVDDCVLMVCDIQDGKLLTLIENERGIRSSSRLLVQVADNLNIPVIVTEQVPSKIGYTHSDIKDVLPPGARVVEKTLFSMINPSVESAIASHGRKTFILCGVETHVCVLQTCLDLLERGFDVHIVSDAISSQRASDREPALKRMVGSGAYLTTAESVVFQLLKTSKHPNFRACSKLCVKRARANASPPTSSSSSATNGAAAGVKTLRLNTSNKDKFAEFKRMFADITKSTVALNRTEIDLKEIAASPVMVVAQKATSAGENVIIEDTSLDVVGADVGVNVRWVLDNLSTLDGRSATWTVMLGVLRGGKVYVYEGKTHGKIVKSSGSGGFGFDPFFLPFGRSKTLAEEKPDEISARYKAVRALLSDAPSAIHVPLPAKEWKGEWQH